MSDFAEQFVDDIVAKEQQARANVVALRSVAPDQAGRANRLSRETGLPADLVERNLGDVEARQQSAQAQRLFSQYPLVSTWAAEPRHAAVSRDDLASLGQLAKVASSRARPVQDDRSTYLRESLASGMRSLYDVAAGTLSDLNPFTTSDDDLAVLYRNDPAGLERSRNASYGFVARFQRRQGQAADDASARADAAAPGVASLRYATTDPSKAAYLSPTRVAGDVLKSGPSSVALMATALLTRKSAVRAQRSALLSGATVQEARAAGVRAAVRTATTVGAASEGVIGMEMQRSQVQRQIETMPEEDLLRSPRYRELLAEGYAPQAARLYIASQQGRAAGIGAGAADAVGNLIGGRIVGRVIGEGGKLVPRVARGFMAEAVTEAGQGVGEQISSNAAMQEVAPDTRLSDNLAESAASGFVVGGVMGGAMTGVFGAAHDVNRQAEMISAANEDAAFLERMRRGAEASKTRQRDPRALAELLQAHLDETGSTEVYVPAEALAEFFQSQDMDWHSPETDYFEFDTSVPQQIDDALASGGDVVLRTSDMIAHLAGTPVWDALKDHVRLSAGGMSLAEAQAAEKDGTNDRLRERFEESLKAGTEQAEPLLRVYQSVRDKLTNAGFTQDAADAQAQIYAQRAVARAKLFGRELTGTEYDHLQVNQVLPPALAPIVAADQLDIAIAALKRSKGARTDAMRFGDSLIEFIAKNGGVEDVGGDLAAMGADKWHKGKAFRKRLLRALQQGEALPGMKRAASGFGLDDVALRAWEAGYFPDHGDTRPTPDDLLEAIRGEVSGTPRYAKDNTNATDQYREVVDELDRILDREGVDGAKASAAEIRQAISRYQAERSAGRGYDQSFSDGPRGRITFTTDGKSVIDLFEARDMSTFIHETGHMFLEELRADAADPLAPQQLRDHWQTVQDWFAANGHPVVDGVIPVEAHELWARAFERYTMEGKAPSSALRKAFDAFKSWMLSVYQVVSNLRAPITPEIRNVMDRMLATEEEITQAAEQQALKALFTDAAAAGMTEAEFAAYQKSVGAARDEAFDALLFRTMATIRASRTAEWKAEEKTVRDEVTASINRRPVFRALDLLRSKGERVRLDRAWLVETYGEDALSLIPGSVPPLFADRETTPADIIAERTGFRTGDEMVRTLMTLGQQTKDLRAAGDKRSVRVATIEQETARIMNERHGDILSDGSIEDEALALIHNDRQGEVIASEMRALSRRKERKTDLEPTPYKLAKEWAAEKIANGKVVDVVSGSAIQMYARAAAKASKAAEAAMLKGDVDETFRQKQAQMLNNALIAEAKKAKDATDAAVKRLSAVAKRRHSPSIDQDYLEQAQALLEQVDLRPASQTALDRREAFSDWSAAQQAAGHDIVVPDSFAETLGKTHWSRLTVEQMAGLDAAVAQIIHLGRFKQKLRDGKEKRDFAAMKAEAIAGTSGMPRKPTVTGFLDPSYPQKAWSFVLAIDAAMLKMETVFGWLDQGNPNGFFTRVIFQRFVDAQEQRRRRILDMRGKLEAARQRIPEAIRKRWSDKVTLGLTDPDTGLPSVMTRDQLVMMALNMGSESSAMKMAGGYRWNEDGIMAELNAHLAVEEATYVQEVWDTIHELWPETAAMERRVNGVAPDKIAARALNIAGVALRGGYFPAVYDPNRSLKVEQNAANDSNRLFEQGYRKASTRAGSTHERTEFKGPILLSLSVIDRHIGEVIHDITHREAVIDANRFLNDPEIVKTIRETLGVEIQQQLDPWIRHIANEWASDAMGTAAVEKFLKGLRSNATFTGLAFRASTIMMQGAGLSNTMEVIGERWMAEGVFRFMRNPIETGRFILATSQEVAARMDNNDRDVSDAVKRELSRAGWIPEVKIFGFHLIGYMDRLVSFVSWMGGYNKALAEGMTEQKAVAYADAVVRKSQSSGAAKDLAAIQRGKGNAGEAMKILTMFYSYLSGFYQRQRVLGRDYNQAIRERNLAKFPRLLARTMWLYFVPALLSQWLAGRGPDDDEDWGLWALKTIGISALGPIPIVRDIAGAVGSGFDYTLSPLGGLGKSVVNLFTDGKRLWDGEETKRATRDMLEAIGYATGKVPGQIAASTQFLVDVAYGEQDPEGLADWWEGMTKGKIKED